MRTLRGVVELRADRARRHRAGRHAAGRARGAARRARPVPAVRAAALRAPGVDRRRHGRRRPRRARRAPAAGVAARLRARRRAAQRQRRADALRRPVIKNVAGYDVSRLLAGSLGILGVIVEVSLKVLPRAAPRRRCASTCKPGEALAQLHAWGGQPLPLDASAWWNGNLVVRLRGAQRRGRRSGARARRRGDRGEPRRRRSGTACATSAIRSSSPPPTRSSTRTRALAPVAAADRAAARPRRRRADRVARRAALARRRRCRRAGARRRRRAVGGHATRFARATSRPACSRRCAPPLRAHPRAAASARSIPKGILNPGRLYPASDDNRPPMQTEHRSRIRRHRRRQRGRGHPAQVRALRLLHRHLPDLPAARRRARRPARPHLPDQAGARRPAPTRATQLHLDRCLTCRNCETHLPVGRAVRQPGRDRPAHRRRARARARPASARCAGR